MSVRDDQPGDEAQSDPLGPEQLAAAAAHDVANALSAVLGWVELASRGDAEPSEAFAAIATAARTARTTARYLLGERDEEVRCVLGSVVRDVTRLLRPSAREAHVVIDTHAAPAAWVGISRSDAFRIAWNLGLNAVQAMQGGTLQLSVERGDTIRLTVADDGPGMDEATRRRVLEGGYTTREGGHGLGLSIVRQLVADAGGTFAIESVPGHGTRFRIGLPAAETPARRSRKRTQARSGVIARDPSVRKVLVVEDDDGVREMVATTLELRGLEVTCARSVEEARGISTPADVALVDLTLGDGGGDEVIADLRARGIVRRIVLMSGMPETGNLPPEKRPDRWLRKPFDSLQLLESLSAPSGSQEATG